MLICSGLRTFAFTRAKPSGTPKFATGILFQIVPVNSRRKQTVESCPHVLQD
jgi:hypothetical protein